MSLELDLPNAIKVLCPRVFPDVAKTNTQRPYVTWQQIGGDVINPIANDIPDKRNAYIQVNVWANTRLEANTLALQIEAALIQSTAFTARPQSALMAAFEDDTDLRGTMQDFTIWALR